MYKFVENVKPTFNFFRRLLFEFWMCFHVKKSFGWGQGESGKKSNQYNLQTVEKTSKGRESPFLMNPGQ